MLMGGTSFSVMSQPRRPTEGQAVQVVDATLDDNRAIQQFSDAELTAILRRFARQRVAAARTGAVHQSTNRPLALTVESGANLQSS